MSYFGIVLFSGNLDDWDRVDEALCELGIPFEIRFAFRPDNLGVFGKAWRIKEKYLKDLPWDGSAINDSLSPDEAEKIYGSRTETPYMPVKVDYEVTTNYSPGFYIYKWRTEYPFGNEDIAQSNWMRYETFDYLRPYFKS